MALTRLLLAIIVLSAALLSPRPAAAQNPGCDLSGIIPESLRVLLGTPWVTERTVAVDEHTLSLRFCAPMSQSAVAEQMLNLAVRALPVLDTLTDVRLDGSLFRTIYMDESQHVYSRGADGYINTQSNQITLHEASWDSTVIHELAHYWADPQRLAEPWMVEAYAEYLTSLAAPQLGVFYTPFKPSAVCDDLPLQRWRNGTGATANCAYSVGSQVLHDLADRAGADTLRQVIGQLSLPPQGVKSDLLLTRLEQVSGANLTPLMQGRVFGPEYDLELSKRSAVRMQFIVTAGMAASLGINPLTMIADDLNEWRHEAAAEKLARLDPLLRSADATRLRCKQLQLACIHPWERLSPDPTSWSTLSNALAAAPQVLTVYEEVSTAAGTLNLTLPDSLKDTAASLTPEGLLGLQAAGVALTQVRQLNQQCAPFGLNCQPYWLSAWERGDLEAVGKIYNELTSILSEATKLEVTCTDLVQKCRQLWRETLDKDGVVAARHTIEELTSLLSKATKLEMTCADRVQNCRQLWREALDKDGVVAARHTIEELTSLLSETTRLEMTCADLGPKCRELWQAALDNGGVVAARQTIEELHALFADSARIEADCKAAGWPCGAGWRIKLNAGDPTAARELLTAQAKALADLVAIEGKINTSNSTNSMVLAPLSNGLGGQAKLEEAHTAFMNGDVVGAKNLAEAALNHRQMVNLWVPLTLILLVVMTLGMGLLIWTRYRQRLVVSLAGQQSAASKPAQSNPSGTNSDLLSQLLSVPPDERCP